MFEKTLLNSYLSGALDVGEMGKLVKLCPLSMIR